MNTAALHDAIAKVAPIDGVSVGRVRDKTTWRIDFADGATDAERAAAAAIVEAFDPDTDGAPSHVLARDIVGWFEDKPALWVKVLAAAPAVPLAAVFLDMLRVRGEKPIDMNAESFKSAWSFMADALGETDAAALRAHLDAVAT